MNERKQPQDWLDAGLAVLGAGGADALTIARLSQDLGVTKGSFYHHFADLAAFKTALLAHHEAVSTTDVIDHLAALATPAARLQRLLAVLADLPDAALERALRGWAATDGQVAATQARIDALRIRYVGGLVSALTGDAERAARCAAALYAVFVGGMHIVPPLAPALMAASLAGVCAGFELPDL